MPFTSPVTYREPKIPVAKRKGDPYKIPTNRVYEVRRLHTKLKKSCCGCQMSQLAGL
jgi:hypothetical protein